MVSSIIYVGSKYVCRRYEFNVYIYGIECCRKVSGNANTVTLMKNTRQKKDYKDLFTSGQDNNNDNNNDNNKSQSVNQSI